MVLQHALDEGVDSVLGRLSGDAQVQRRRARRSPGRAHPAPRYVEHVSCLQRPLPLTTKNDSNQNQRNLQQPVHDCIGRDSVGGHQRASKDTPRVCHCIRPSRGLGRQPPAARERARPAGRGSAGGRQSTASPPRVEGQRGPAAPRSPTDSLRPQKLCPITFRCPSTERASRHIPKARPCGAVA